MLFRSGDNPGARSPRSITDNLAANDAGVPADAAVSPPVADVAVVSPPVADVAVADVAVADPPVGLAGPEHAAPSNAPTTNSGTNGGTDDRITTSVARS